MAGFGLIICLIVALACARFDTCAAQPASERTDPPGDASGATPPAPRGLFTRRRQAVAPIKSLTIAVWSMPALPHAAESGYRPGESEQRWRNTFGSERRSAAWRWLGPAGLDADVILLQGIVDVGTVRRLFGARTHLFVISRQILVRPKKTAGVTGVVIRRRRGLGISKFQHIWWRPHSYPIPPGDAVNALPAAITAVRLRTADRQFWVASVAVGSGCNATVNKAGAVPEPGNVTPEFRCQGFRGLRDYFTSWLGQLPAEDDPIILGGTGAMAKLAAKRDVKLLRPTHAAERCGARTPRLILLKRAAGNKAAGPAGKHSPARQPSLGKPRDTAKRKCALLAEIYLGQP
jgi:hypothetical protein